MIYRWNGVFTLGYDEYHIQLSPKSWLTFKYGGEIDLYLGPLSGHRVFWEKQ